MDIDGQIPYGGFYGTPKTEIDQLNIEINDKEVLIPNSAFSNFYSPNTCEDHPVVSFVRKPEAFISLDGKYLYLYFEGGNAAGTYFTKLVFDKENYLTKIAADYYPLSIYGSFGREFLGY